jgi:DNA-binding response OmpR family regulator
MNNHGAVAVRKTVLLIEDSEDIVSIVKFMLEREGYEVATAIDGREAEKAIESAPPPGIIILDVMLPYVDGFSLLQKIRKSESPGWSSVPVIMLTAKGGHADVLRGFETGADDYLVKPFDTGELLARIRRLLRQR